jgi:hypothetical protein
LLYSSEEQSTDHTAKSQVPLEFSFLINQFKDIFTEPTELPPHRQADHSIPLLPGSKPPNVHPYWMSHSQKNTMEALIKQVLQKGEICQSCSPFSSPIILVKKKDKSWRLCVDFKSLNNITIKNKFPIRVIEDLLDELHGAKFFSKLDLKSGNHQIIMQ